MSERTTAKHVSIDLDGFKSSVDKQFAFLFKLVFGVYALIGAVVGGGFLLRTDLGEIKAQGVKSDTEIVGLRRDMTGVQERVKELEKTTSSQISSLQKEVTERGDKIIASLTEINSKLPTQSPLLSLSRNEEQLIRDFFGISKVPAKGPSKYSLGDVVPNTIPMPDSLIAKVPKLKGFAYAKDPNNGSILIVDGRAQVVAVVVPESSGG
jgi:hypothetical protein